MNLSNVIAAMISQMLSESDEIEIQRNTLAQKIGCVPSQINYVLSSRFTPERGYIVESRRGGGGCIRISRIDCGGETLLMNVYGSVGDSIDERSCEGHLVNLVYNSIISKNDARLMLSALGDGALKPVRAAARDAVRASVFKQMLLSIIQNWEE